MNYIPTLSLSRVAGVSEAGARRRNPERSEGSSCRRGGTPIATRLLGSSDVRFPAVSAIMALR
jgi:hypothetical protein